MVCPFLVTQYKSCVDSGLNYTVNLLCEFIDCPFEGRIVPAYLFKVLFSLQQCALKIQYLVPKPLSDSNSAIS